MDAVYIANLAVNGIVVGFVVALAALAINLAFAVARFTNAATGDYVTFGSYAGLITQWGGIKSSIAKGLVAMVATAAISVAFYFAVFRPLRSRPMVASMIASIGVLFFLRYTLTLFVGHDMQMYEVPPRRPYFFFGVRVLPIDLWLSAVALCSLFIVFIVLHRTPFGRSMRAVADNADLARTCGIKADQVMVCLWLMVGAICGVAGVIFGIKTVVTPETGWDLLLAAFAAAILGGVGSPIGAVIAGVLLGVVQEVSTLAVGFTYKTAIAYLTLILVLVLRPQGLFGLKERVR